MPVTFPGAAIAVSGFALVFFAASLADKDPRAFILQLHPVHRTKFFGAGMAYLCFHNTE
jgi:hypothetical protein